MMGFDKDEMALGPKNFKYLDELIHSGAKEIVLESDIVLSDGEESQYPEGIRLDIDDVAIDGNGHSIDANAKARIFHCTGKNITIKNILLKNGFSDIGGGICNSGGELTITESTLNNNTAEYGGAIYNDGGELTISESTIINNTAKCGGAINSYYGELTITESTLNDNTAERNGGAIRNAWGELTITDSTLNDNTAERNGGAICNSGGELIIHGSTLAGNTAQGTMYVDGGGAICNFKGDITITESTVTENIARIRGGAIYNKESGLTITESTLTENTAEVEGGVIYNDGGELTITESTLAENTAKFAGAICNSGGELTITDSTLNENNGGAIHNRWGELMITSSTLTQNTARNHGGAIHNEDGNFKIFNCEFSSNKSSNDIIFNNDSLQIHNVIFRDNKSKYVVLNEGDGANLGIFNGEFKENIIKESVLCNTGKFCTVEKTVFQNNISNNTMNIINKSELTLTNPKIKDKGKSILNQKYMLIRNSPLELENLIYGEGTVETIENRIPQGENYDFGYMDKKIHESNTKEVILGHDITLENYERDFYEGGIELDIDNIIIDGNGHTIDGADNSRIFIITGKNITLKNIAFKNGCSHKNYDNLRNNNGGAIRINYDSNISIENCEFLNNASEVYGGAIFNRGELTITESIFTGNTAKELGGGAIYNFVGLLTIAGSTLMGNTTEWNGGAINNIRGRLTIHGSTLTGNTAEWSGGAIDNREGLLTVYGSIFTENTANRGGGGAIYLEKSESELNDCTFKDNKPEDVYERKD